MNCSLTTVNTDESLYSCTCFECGFHSNEYPVHCALRDGNTHCGLCKDCMDSFHVFQDLHKLYDQAYNRATELKLFDCEAKLIDDFDLWSRGLNLFERNFLKYRAHLAQAEDEGLADAQFYDKLKEGQAVVIMDFKMKILSSLYREAQIDWFGKSGFSCLGALILMPAGADENKVVYHLFISGDTTQDSEYVNTVKEYLYKYILPTYGIEEVHFRCDGAGCFVAAGIKAQFAHWKGRTGIEELSYKNNVPGKGKSPLDCLFGILSQQLTSAIDEGASFNNETELYLLCATNPLNNTYYHLLNLDREKMNWSNDVHKAIKDLKIGRKYYLLINNDNEVRGFTHSRHGAGDVIPLLKGM